MYSAPFASRVIFAVPLTFALFLAAACGGDDDDDGDQKGGYFDAPAYGTAECDTSDGKLAGQRELRLFASRGIDVRGDTRALQRYYRRHGLTFSTNGEVGTTSTPYALDTNTLALSLALTQEYPGVNLNDSAALMADPALNERVQASAARFIFRPIIDFARAHGTAGGGHTNLVLLPTMERPDGAKLFEGMGKSLAGMALSPTLLDLYIQQGNQEGRLFQSLGLPPGFTPMMFMHHTLLSTLAQQNTLAREFVIAHEFGHASGLPHHELVSNLMYPTTSASVSGCARQRLTDQQLATMRTALGLSAAGQALRVQPAQPDLDHHAARPLSPQRFRAMLAGDREAMREFLSPFLHPIETPNL